MQRVTQTIGGREFTVGDKFEYARSDRPYKQVHIRTMSSDTAEVDARTDSRKRWRPQGEIPLTRLTPRSHYNRL